MQDLLELPGERRHPGFRGGQTVDGFLEFLQVEIELDPGHAAVVGYDGPTLLKPGWMGFDHQVKQPVHVSVLGREPNFYGRRGLRQPVPRGLHVAVLTPQGPKRLPGLNLHLLGQLFGAVIGHRSSGLPGNLRCGCSFVLAHLPRDHFGDLSRVHLLPALRCG